MIRSILLTATLLFSNQSFASQTGTSSYYGHGFHGKKTASGQRFNMYGMSMAHRTIKLGSKVKVTNLNNGKTVIVLCNDRGPYVRGRIADLSYGAKNALKMGGIAKVRLEVLN